MQLTTLFASSSNLNTVNDTVHGNPCINIIFCKEIVCCIAILWAGRWLLCKMYLTLVGEVLVVSYSGKHRQRRYW